ncbi:hypothetical protein TDB9533_02611 [Thalassocella blandensis]|nr:hypothetical protein TDB9533_02611 [Thalassocella blandensis]
MKKVSWLLVITLCCVTVNAHSQALQQCQTELQEYREITELAREQIEELQTSNSQKDELIAKHKVKIELLQKRIALLQSGDAVSSEMVALLQQNQDVCLATEQQAYELMQKIMQDYQQAVSKAIKPWYLDPAFYGGLVLGVLIML